MMRSLKVILLALMCLSRLSAPAWSQEQFKDLFSSDGDLIQARVLGVKGGKVALIRKTDGRKFTVPLDRFDKNTRAMLESGEVFTTDDVGRPTNRKLYPRTRNDLAAALDTINAAAQSQAAFPDEQRQALASLNAYRYLCGLPHKVILDQGLCESARKAATGCASIGRLSHDVNAEAGKCNLHSGIGLADSIHGYMNDNGASNRADRAHRQWCLSPRLGKFGIGKEGQFSAMWTMDKSGPKPRYADDFFAYPSRGFFPVKYINPATAWSVYFPGGKLPPNDQIELKVYKLNKALVKAPSGTSAPPNSTEVAIKFLSTSQWVMPCINFEPAAEVAPGKRYWVSVKAGDSRAGYLVEFVK
ncbi:MAG: CAP domain-containing protein [Verrucomicrobiaceae bacterium]|nr:CAP domain-containing protein [Verrucomicrobiaceae bacterium]